MLELYWLIFMFFNYCKHFSLCIAFKCAAQITYEWGSYV